MLQSKLVKGVRMRYLYTLATLVCLGLIPARAEPPHCGDYLHIWWDNLCNQVWSCPQPCPDDYCNKPFPPYDPRAKCGVNDYCYKPFPRCDKRACPGIDDYQGKPCTKIDPLCQYPKWYLCVPCKGMYGSQSNSSCSSTDHESR